MESVIRYAERWLLGRQFDEQSVAHPHLEKTEEELPAANEASGQTGQREHHDHVTQNWPCYVNAMAHDGLQTPPRWWDGV
jgi:hypothetical protein